MQNVPRTLPWEERTGFDQDARRPCFRAEARCSGTSHSGSVAMSETITGKPRYAAVPQEPAHGPIGISSICRVHSLGSFGPAMTFRWTPSGFINKTEASVPGLCSSIIPHNALRICFSGTPVAIISRSCFSPWSKDSARFRSSMSTFVPYQRTILPDSSRSGTPWVRNQR
jgi:hypothetical protein